MRAFKAPFSCLFLNKPRRALSLSARRRKKRRFSVRNALLKQLPVSSADKAVLGEEAAYWGQWMAHPVPDRYWADAMFSEKLKNIGIPIFHQSGWFDSFFRR